MLSNPDSGNNDVLFAGSLAVAVGVGFAGLLGAAGAALDPKKSSFAGMLGAAGATLAPKKSSSSFTCGQVQVGHAAESTL